MNKQQILEVILKHTRRNVDGLDGREIDPSRSLASYGASSLDIVEIVSTSMRELRLRVPRTRLAGLKNIDELAELFTLIASEGSK